MLPCVVVDVGAAGDPGVLLWGAARRTHAAPLEAPGHRSVGRCKRRHEAVLYYRKELSNQESIYVPTVARKGVAGGYGDRDV